MSKSFGKIVLISTILAGAAVGSYAYFKKEKGVMTDNEEFLNKERSYVDLSPEAAAEKTAEEAVKAEEEKTEEVKTEEEAKETFEPGIAADKIESADDNIIGSKTSEEFFNDEEEV